MRHLRVSQPSNGAAAILCLAVWSGLVTGMLEGVALLALQQLDWLTQDSALKDVALEIVWISALFNALLFGACGLVLAVVLHYCPRLPSTQCAVFLFAVLMFLDWLTVMLIGRIHHYALFILAMGLAMVLTRWFRRYETACWRFWRQSLPGVAAVALLVLVSIQGFLWLRERTAIAQLPAAPPGAPNVVVIVVDALRADHLSSYGYARPTSPNLDRLAQQGVLFEYAFATSSWTAPSHASLLTGRYPYEHGLEWQRPRALFDSHYPTLPEVLRAHGYRTAAVSANLFWFTRPIGFGRGFIRFEDYFHSIGDMVLRTLYGRIIEKFALPALGFNDIPARKRASDINRSILHWMERDRDKPSFTFLNYMDTHDPYLPPSPYRTKFASSKNPGGILNWRKGRHPQMTPEQLQGEIDAYDGAIAYVDDHIAALLLELQQRGFGANTLVIITSDHGEAFGEHGAFLHANSLYREEISVPLIFWWPGHVPAGVRITQPVTNAMLPATVMELIGLGNQKLFPGPSLASLWQDQTRRDNWPLLLAEIAQQPWAAKKAPVYQGPMKALISPEWHYIMHEKLGIEVYAWQSDPGEVHNLAARPEMACVLKQFHSHMLEAVGPEQATAQKRFKTPF